MPKITDLAAQTAPDTADVVAIVDVSAGVTNKITRTNFLKGAPLPADTVDTQAVADDAITAPKLSDSAVTPEIILAGTGSSWVWQSWTPTFFNFTVGSATLQCFYTQIGKTVHFRMRIVLSGSTVSGLIQFTLPVEAKANLELSEGTVLGVSRYLDSGTASYYGVCKVVSNNAQRAEFLVNEAAATYLRAVGTTSTIPMTWANNDTIMVIGTYEAI